MHFILCTLYRYTIIHRGELDIQDYTCERTSKAIKRPKDLVVTIELPGVVCYINQNIYLIYICIIYKDTAANLEVDIFEKAVVLNHTQPQYHLKVRTIILIITSLSLSLSL